MWVKMIEAINTPQTFSLAETKWVNGRAIASYKAKRFLPGKKYEVPDDELFIRSLQNTKKKVRYDAEIEAVLKKSGSSYEIVTCKSCGGRVKKIEYSVFEVGE